MKLKKKLLIIIPIIVALLAGVGIFLYFNYYTDDKTNLSVSEKKWVSENSKTKYDFEIVTNVPLFSLDGKGIIINFITDLEDTIGLEFNKISYAKENKPSTNGLRIEILNNETALTDKNLLIAEDGYVAISKNNIRYEKISDIKDQTIGVFTEDSGELSYYLKTGSNLTYKTYDNITSMLNDLNDGNISMVIIPQYIYLDQTIASDSLYTNYYFTEMSKKIVITLTSDNNNLNKVIRKYFEKWKKDNYVDSFNKEYLDYYTTMNKINDKQKADLISKIYVYGYVENAPYQKEVSKTPSGIASEYVARMQRLTNIDFTYKKYKTVDELKKAINNKEVDIYYNDFGYTTGDYKNTISTFPEEYVVLGSTKNNQIVNTFEELKGKQVKMLSDNVLVLYFQENSKAIIKTEKNIKGLLDSDIIIVDKEIYEYYKHSKFNKYEILYTGNITNEYLFSIKNENESFYKLFNYIIGTNSYYNYRINGLDSLDLSLIEKTSFSQLYLMIIGLLLLPLLVLAIIYLLLKRNKQVSEVRKADRRKYTDMLTSLKNRNYLNLNVEKWENSKIYPQSVIVIDLNNIKYVNDNYGHEAGDQLIVSAASILVNTQLENSEIIRTDGNEFLIYLVGYSEKQIDTYCKKLNKELKNLPHGFGAALGYSMITDDIKTIDDAMNEAVLDMRNTKEKEKENY